MFDKLPSNSLAKSICIVSSVPVFQKKSAELNNEHSCKIESESGVAGSEGSTSIIDQQVQSKFPSQSLCALILVNKLYE